MPLRILCAPEVDSCHAQDRVGQDRAEQEKSRARQYWAGQVQARLGQNRASPEGQQGTAGADNTGLGCAGLSLAGQSSVSYWMNALRRFAGPGALVPHKQLHVGAGPGAPIQSGHMGGLR